MRPAWSAPRPASPTTPGRARATLASASPATPTRRRRVGATGKAYGLDMTEEMLALARANQARAGADNVEFLKGDIEAIPLPDASVEVIISNCVINLAADKAQVLREAFRVLKPGGRLAVSDVVARRAVLDQVRTSMELWMGCVAGALQETEYVRLLAAAGFTDIAIEPTRIYDAADARARRPRRGRGAVTASAARVLRSAGLTARRTPAPTAAATCASSLPSPQSHQRHPHPPRLACILASPFPCPRTAPARPRLRRRSRLTGVCGRCHSQANRPSWRCRPPAIPSRTGQ
jgi:hypothetical protein